MATLSASDIAKKIGRTGEDMRVVGDRIRNWTREGLLTPVGDKNPGTGRSRQYPETALFDALLLTTLTEAIGLQTVKVHAFPEVFECARKFLKPSHQDKGLLLISRGGRSRKTRVRLVSEAGLMEALEDVPADGHIVINLLRMLI